MSRTYFDMTALADAAKTNDCTVHLHHDELGCPIFSIGNSNTGAREFASYQAALKFAAGDKFDEADLAEQAGAALAINCLNDILNSPSQAVSVTALQNALLDLQRLPHQERAAGGFAVAMVNSIEQGLDAAKGCKS